MLLQVGGGSATTVRGERDSQFHEASITYQSERVLLSAELHIILFFFFGTYTLDFNLDNLHCYNCPNTHRINEQCKFSFSGNVLAKICSGAPVLFQTYTFVFVHRLGSDQAYSFTSTDPDVVSQLPLSLRILFPAYLTPKCGIDKTIVQELIAQGASKTNFSAMQETIVRMHSTRYHEQAVRFLSVIKERREAGLSFSVPENFSEPSDPTGYDDVVPSTRYLIDAFKAAHELRRPTIDKYQSSLTASRLSVDHSFKVSKRFVMFIKDVAGRSFRPFSAFFNVMNEWKQIVHQRLCVSKSQDEIIPMLEEVNRNIQGNDGPPIEVSC
jgi:hypothetical protein